MASSVGGVSSASQYQSTQHVKPQQVRGGRDSDGDNDGSKPREVEKAEANKGPVSETIGNKINTTA